jgi:hypothetical protein
MSEYKAGLHKNVSAIFNGVSLPNPVRDASRQDDGAQRPSVTPSPAHQDYDAPKPPAVTSPASSPAVLKQPSTTSPAAPKPVAPEPSAQKPRAPSHMTPNKPKPQQAFLQSQKETPAKQPKANAAVKAAEKAQWQRTLERIKNKLFATESGVGTTKQKIMVILAPVLFVVLILMFVRAFSTPSRKITGTGTSGPVETVAAHSKVDWQIPNPYPTTLRDPMQFSSSRSQTATGELIVKGIVYSEDRPSAVIGDQIVHQGDKILDVVITKINENSVEFEANSKKWIQNVQR